MAKIKLTIAGGMYSVVDVLEAFAQKQATAVTVNNDYKLSDASVSVTPENLMLGEVIVEGEFADADKERILNELADQFVGIGFRFDEVEA